MSIVSFFRRWNISGQVKRELADQKMNNALRRTLHEKLVRERLAAFYERTKQAKQIKQDHPPNALVKHNIIASIDQSAIVKRFPTAKESIREKERALAKDPKPPR
ncbi:MAG: hypothetical protein NTY48_02900 [Candidatus Diapherotrites archaeon]|nr:hypothetical protein [Candidatus Diapherotrites archaeon]